MGEKKERGGVTFMVVPEGAGAPRSVRLSDRGVRVLFGSLLAGAVLLLLLLGSWWYTASRAYRAWQLEAQVETLLQDQARIGELARRFAEVEAGYERLRGMLGADSVNNPGGVWLPPAPSPGGAGVRAEDGEDDGLPTSWPLTERGFITQPLLIGGGGGGEHPGLDIAVPAGSYIRAAGSGTVTETGDDPVYGYFVRIQHEAGYESVYAHASLLLVEVGEDVARNEVIALTGSTGRSSAPHLHFEILRDGEPVDPLSMVTPP